MSTPYALPESSAAASSLVRSDQAAAPKLSIALTPRVTAVNAPRDEPKSDKLQLRDASSSWASELARKVSHVNDNSAAHSRKISLSKPMPAANATFSAEVSASQASQSQGPQADATIVQRATFLNHESQSIHALNSKLLSYEGNMRIMQCALDELRRQNIELVRASTQSKNDQVDDALRQLAIALNQLRF